MSLPFPTGPTLDGRNIPPPLGEPTRAVACWCENGWLDEPGSCCRCGHWTDEAIRETWRAQARRVAVSERRLNGSLVAA
jgi:hypothetical protein